MKLPISKRLLLCTELITSCDTVADVGTDHGYLPVFLCRSGRIPSALACDINPLPLQSARENIARYGLSDRIEPRLSDGLREVRQTEVDDIVIAGMGGELIRDILSAAPWVKSPDKRLILQPMTHHEDLLKWLFENGFAILRQEAVLDEGKYYTVLSAVCDGKVRDCGLFDCIVGRLEPADPLCRGFLSRCLNNLRNRSKGDPSLLPIIRRIEEYIHVDQGDR